MVLDEPTNDLDLETLELLEARLVEWPGTLLVVSHDRAFLDNVVTSTFAFEGDGHISEYVGGYEDYVRQRRPPAPDATMRAPNSPAERIPSPESSPKKLSYREQRELDALPTRIDALEAEQRALAAAISDPLFYQERPASIAAAFERAEALERELGDLYARWDVLDSRA